MALKICLGCYSLRYPKAGGYTWMFINWALGLKSLDVELIWLDSMLVETPNENKKTAIQELKTQLGYFGIGNMVVMNNDASKIDIDIPECQVDDSFFENIDLFINLGYDLPGSFIAKFRKKVFIDLDPGQTQVWLSLKHLYIPEHDHYFTYGETVGKSSLIPNAGINWIYTPPAISSQQWLPDHQVESSMTFTTVSNWWGSWFTFQDELFDNSKRMAFLKYKDLPGLINSPVEIAAFFKDGHDEQEIAMLRDLGWQVRHVLEVSDTPFSFYNYVQQSRGEFSCLLPAYTRLQTAWTSERSLNYLAAGKPVILSDTGESSILPKNEGILRFSDIGQAVKCFEDVEMNYNFHSKRARELIKEYFEASKIVKRILEISL